MDFFKNKVALVTGAGKGIGRSTAIHFASLGAKVALISRTKQEVEGVAADIRSRFQTDAFATSGDVGNEQAVLSLFDQIHARWGPVDFLVNNAAILHRAPVVDLKVESWDLVMAANLRGPFLCCREMLRSRKAAPRAGAIVNITSLAGVRGTEKFPGFSSYVVSKFGIVGLTESLAVEAKPFGIRINALALGAVDTELLRKNVPELKTTARPEDIAPIIAYFCDDTQSRVVTGSTLEVFTNSA